MKRFILLGVCFFLLPFSGVFAQKRNAATETQNTENQTIETQEAETEEKEKAPAAADAGRAEDADAGADSEASYIEMDIKTSTLMELAAWCRELGLPEGGTKEDLASRLRGYYKISTPKSAGGGQRVITIESAKTTEYFTLDVVDEEYARLKGDVIVSLKDGNATHRIKAWEILYNRTRNVMTASGNVEYTKEDGNAVETFKGASITVNLDNWSSIFMDGASTKSGVANASAYRFAGTIISRNDEEVTVLTKADITNPENDEAYWSLHASKLWLLPGNDWAILNAVLKVGNIPVLYLPFFYYPADEIVFHPVLGSRTRDGTFFQTTTYILGRPKAQQMEENAIFKIFGGGADDSDKKLEGVFLRSTGEKKTNPGDIQLSVMLDAYVNLGYFLGTKLILPRKGVFGDINIEAGLGLTRDIFSKNGNFTPFPQDGEWEWNRSTFFNYGGIPFRYRLKFNGSTQFKYGSFSWDLPLYSDPYVERDFIERRSELLDWYAMLRDGFSPGDTDIINPLSSPTWSFNGSLRPQLGFLAPYVSSISIGSITSSLAFTSKYYRDDDPTFSPEEIQNPKTMYFIPNKFTMYSVNASISGTPLNLGASSNKRINSGTREAAPGDALLSDMPVSPWVSPGVTPGVSPADKPGQGYGEEKGADPSSPDEYIFTLPALAQKFDLNNATGMRFSINYSLSPSASSVMNFDPAEWERENINWTHVTDIYYNLRSGGNIGLKADTVGNGFFSGTLNFSGTGNWKGITIFTEASKYKAAGTIRTIQADCDGTVVSFEKDVGDLVDVGDTIMIINDGSVNMDLKSTAKGELKEFLVTIGQTVTKGDTVTITPATNVARLDYTPELKALDEVYKERTFTSSWDFSATIKPFSWSSVWGDSSLQYSVSGLLAKNTPNTDGISPRYPWTFGWENWFFGKKEDNSIKTHSATASISANVMDYKQTISLSASIWPNEPVLSGNATFRAWISTTTVSTKFNVNKRSDSTLLDKNAYNLWSSGTLYKKGERVVYSNSVYECIEEHTSLSTFETAKWTRDIPTRLWDPVNITESLQFSGWGSFSQTVKLDPERWEDISLNSTLNLTKLNFSATFKAGYVQNYDIDDVTLKWGTDNTMSFQPQQLMLKYEVTFGEKSFFGNRLSFYANFNTNFQFEFQKYTDSQFVFNFSLRMKVINFLDFQISTNSRNDVLYRYFPSFFRDPLDQGYNFWDFFGDIFKSFRFDDPTLRKESGFKVKNLSISLNHYLGDWIASLTVDMRPVSSSGTVKFVNDISFMIQWVPINEIRTELLYKDEKLTVK